MAPRLPLLPMLLVLSVGPRPPGALATRGTLQSQYNPPMCWHPEQLQNSHSHRPYIVTPEGSSINITCCIHGFLHGIYLKKSSWPKEANVTYDDNKDPTIDSRFRVCITFSGPQHNLQSADTGTYFCEAIMEVDKASGSGTLVMVTDTLFQTVSTCQESQLINFIVVIALGVGFFLIALGLGAMCMLRRMQLKKLCWARDRSSVCVVYKDMSCSRQDTTLNHYQ
ncbi:T-cell antigen CD7 [Saccopteryx bilineata]|uniref:T-cell antigen CD7 n=1 Tax=Saccopteryx bilineata TaxID=59482 RepID=UPI00338F6B68